uniref:NADH dehydrogenase subunit 4L n=1 Tax=Bactrothrips quadrituberculatus TaxID=1246465 RepID=A0A8E5JZL1_9NEOP|nr:NADH dehydrogenase subunit 4L [Bactrothrips quadrituberculatus]QVD42821.1 NADH dehydrogenase subunit 4L [Bactrothrips quadrituberculatus]
MLTLIVLLFFSFIKNYYHFMNMLMVFECFIMLIFFSLNFYQELMYLFIFCVFSVCESSLGLSLMIILIRCSGSDFCSMKFLSC